MCSVILTKGTFQHLNPHADATKRENQYRRKLTNKSAEIEIYRRFHGDLFNLPRLLLPGAQLQIKFTKSKGEFYVMISKVDTGAVFRFLDAMLTVRQVKRSPTIQLAHAKALEK
jgi:hypothetical protein